MYRAEIDGLRALAVVPVIMFHAGNEVFSGGFVGVDVFFVISGYLITTILFEDIERQRFSFINFYERRARRILPVLYVVVFTTAVLSYFVLYPVDLVSFSKSVVSIPVFLSNFYFWSERGYFNASAELKPVIHTWSLAVEEQFYIVFPIVMVLLSRHLKGLFTVLFLVFVMSIGSSYYITLLHFDTAFYFPFTRAWELLTGSFCAFLLFKYRFRIRKSVANILSLFGIALIFYAYKYFDKSTLFPYVNAVIPVLGSASIILFACEGTVVRKILSLRPVVFIGLISYSLYLWHQPIFSLARHLRKFEGNVEVLILTTFLFSLLTFYYVERPFRDKDLIRKNAVFAYSAVGGILLMLIGSIGVAQQGFPGRYDAADRSLLLQLASGRSYNEKRFNEILSRKFSNEDTYKVVIAGDSHARDFLNIIAESSMFDDYEFSSKQINAECGNLYLYNYDEIKKYIPDSRKKRCIAMGWFEGSQIKQLLDEADEVWLVAAWQEWVVEYLPRSIENMRNEYEKPIRVFGIKNFGNINPNELLEVPKHLRNSFIQPVQSTSSGISLRIDELLGTYEFYHPVLDALCDGSRLRCKIFTDEGLLMSVDGGHLTKEGAIEAVSRVEKTLLNLRGK